MSKEEIKKILSDHTSFAAYKKCIKEKFPEVDEKISSMPYRYAESVYMYVNDISARPGCKFCNKPLKYVDRSTGYGIYCSHKCYVDDGCSTEKRKDTCLNKYGSINSLGNSEIRQKRKKTMIDRYGSEHPLQNSDLLEKSKKTYRDNYTDNVVIKRKATQKKKYGTENLWNLREFRNKIEDHNLEKFGVAWVQQNSDVKEKGKITRRRNFYKNLKERCPDVTPKFTEDQFVDVGTRYTWLCHKCNQDFEDNIDDGSYPICRTCYPVTTGTSLGEKELVYFLTNELGVDNIVQNCKNLISPKEIDIYLPDLKIGIEYNGIYWHSDKKVAKDYHQQKFLAAREQGAQLIQIFEDEWMFKKEIVKARLRHILKKSDTICYARQCQIKKISTQEYKDFVIRTHIQGYVPAKIIYGAYYNDSLVGVMSFGTRSIYGKKIEGIELLRFSTSGNIPGLASKLFSKFVKDENPSRVYSYCDLRWGTGTVYTNIGMHLDDITVPGYTYSKDGVNRIHRYSLSKHKLGIDKESNLTERSVTDSLGYYRVFDAGNYKFVWNKT